MDIILWEFRKYNVEYNRKLQIIEIYNKIPVQDFINLRLALSKTSRPINDIRVYGEKKYELKRRD